MGDRPAETHRRHHRPARRSPRSRASPALASSWCHCGGPQPASWHRRLSALPYRCRSTERAAAQANAHSSFLFEDKLLDWLTLRLHGFKPRRCAKPYACEPRAHAASTRTQQTSSASVCRQQIAAARRQQCVMQLYKLRNQQAWRKRPAVNIFTWKNSCSNGRHHIQM